MGCIQAIVHEWGHLRYGLKDEYPIPTDGYKRFYETDGGLNYEATRCSLDLTGNKTLHAVM
jgi:hypothetical protein